MSSVIRTCRSISVRSRLGLLLSVSAGSIVLVPSVALADCTADSTGLIVTCTGSSTGYSNVSTGVGLTADSTAAVTGPILLGNTATVTNGGSFAGTANTPELQLGTNGSVVNNGTISLSNAASGSAAISVGDSGMVTNNGSLSATAGTPVLQFGQAGTFINSSTATAVVSGNILFGPNLGGGTSTLTNNNTAFGIVGNISSTGNTTINNAGLLSGSFIQTATSGTVAFNNSATGNWTGSIDTGDVTNLSNLGTMSVTTLSDIGTARLASSSFNNVGTLNVGTTEPTELIVNGSFVNAPSGVINIALHSSGATAPVAGGTYSQIYAAGPGGTATLGGTLNIVPTPGFYQTGSTYNVILADQGITGSFATVNGSSLPFISFVPVGITTIGSQQVYQVEAERIATYAQALAATATPAELAIAGALNPVVAAANLDPTSAAATLVGQIDLLTVPQAETLLDQINPAPYGALAQSLRDQSNLFTRQVMLRTTDQNSEHPESGVWFQGSAQRHFGSTSSSSLPQEIIGVTAGYDISGPRYVLGGALSYSSATLHNADRSFAGHDNAYQLAAYGAYHVGPVVLTGQLGYELGNIGATKTLDLSYTTTTTAATSTTAATTTTAATPTTVTASSADHLLKATATLGFDIKARSVTVTPFAGIDYSAGAISGFAESGAGSADLTVNRISASRTDLIAGLNATASSGQMRPYLRADYRSELGSANSSVSAYFNSDPTAGFTVDATGVARHQFDVDAGVNIVFDDEGGFFLGYQGTLRRGASEHGLQGGMRLQF